MKVLSLLIVSLLMSYAAYFNYSGTPAPAPDCAEGSEKMSCCQMKRTAQTDAIGLFASLTNDVNFVNKHEEPIPIHYKTLAGEKITFKASDGEDASAMLFKAKKTSNNYLLVIHEWWGLNDHIQKEAERFYNDLKKKNVNVIALDMYDGKIATTREDAAKYMQAMKTERGAAIVQGLLNYVGKNAKIATVGWCFGGGWSLQSSIIAENQAVGCIIYYGMPEKDKERLKKLNAEVLGIFAGQEQWISPKLVQEFEANLKELGKKNTIKMFDADHAFANPSNPKYNKVMAEEAYAMSLKFLKSKF
ncbi:MAG: dienelactone hydrolase family protein [Microscillaceae bacterium]|jgi:carboxymethylenebutenolidase|nr:dienelactone hydrolase family protein [Microscillaceae bacterium]